MMHVPGVTRLCFVTDFYLIQGGREGERETSMMRENHGPAASGMPPLGIAPATWACALCPDRNGALTWLPGRSLSHVARRKHCLFLVSCL